MRPALGDGDNEFAREMGRGGDGGRGGAADGGGFPRSMNYRPAILKPLSLKKSSSQSFSLNSVTFGSFSSAARLTDPGERNGGCRIKMLTSDPAPPRDAEERKQPKFTKTSI